MVIAFILLSIFLALCYFGWLRAYTQLRADLDEMAELNGKLLATVTLAQQYNIEYVDQSVLAHEKMAHTGYEKYEPKS